MFGKNIDHALADLQEFPDIMNQYHYRLDLVMETLKSAQINIAGIDAVVGRGGLLEPVAGGTYVINEKMLEDLKTARRGAHASNLGAMLAYAVGQSINKPSYIVDPVAVDEMEDIARLSGFPDIERVSLFHALNHKAVARKAARQMGREYEAVNFIVAHMGSGISVAAHKKGRVIDVNDAKQEGPFSPDRTGGLPAFQLMQLCYSGKFTLEQMKKKLMSEGGIYAYLGTKDLRAALRMADEGNERARLVLDGMAYQVAKEIGVQAAVLSGEVDRIVLTGGIANSEYIVDKIKERVKFIAPIEVFPGENEMESMANGVLEVLRGRCKAKIYE